MTSPIQRKPWVQGTYHCAVPYKLHCCFWPTAKQVNDHSNDGLILLKARVNNLDPDNSDKVLQLGNSVARLDGALNGGEAVAENHCLGYR